MGDAQGRTWGPKYALTESVNRLTHPVKTPKNAHNTRFFQLARSDRAGRSVALGPEIRGRTALALRLSLRHNPLVNKRADRRRDYWRAPLLWRTPRWITKKGFVAKINFALFHDCWRLTR